MGDQRLVVVVTGVKLSPVLPILALGVHILLGIARSAMACHGGVGPIILSPTYRQHPMEEKTMEGLRNVETSLISIARVYVLRVGEGSCTQ